MVYLVDREFHEICGIQCDLILQAVWHSLFQFLKSFSDSFRYLYSICSWLLVNSDGRCRNAIQPVVVNVCPAANLGAGNVFNTNDCASILACPEDDVFILCRCYERCLCYYRKRKLNLGIIRLLTNLTCAKEGVLFCHGSLNIGCGNAKGSHPIRVHPYSHCLISYPENLSLSCALHTFDSIEHKDIGIVIHIIRAVPAVLIENCQNHENTRRFFLNRDTIFCHSVRKLRSSKVDPVLHLHLRDVRVCIQAEIDCYSHLSRVGTR